MSKFASLICTGVLAAGLVGSATTAYTQQTTPDASGVNVTIKYTGKGTVDDTHKIWVWLFDSPDIGPGAIPIAEMSMAKNGGTATFSMVSAKPVYIAVAYDEAGGFGGQAPPPPGSPIALYGVKTGSEPPAPVTPGPKVTVTIAFDDSQRMQ